MSAKIVAAGQRTKDYNGKNQKDEGIQPQSLGKGDLKWRKLGGKMKRQRNTAHMKEQGRNSQDQINEEERSNLTERESK